MTRTIVTKTAKCKRCNSTTVTWNQGTSGKWYLTEVFDYEGFLKSDHKDFHSNYCGKPELHKAEQDEINGDYAKQEERREQAATKSAADTADYFLGLHDLCKADPDAARAMLAELERKVKYEEAHWISMDYFTDSCRQQDQVKRMKTEIRFMEAALGITTYDGDTIS
jgi:hypothetical protein